MLFSIQNSFRISLERTHFEAINWSRIVGLMSAFIGAILFNTQKMIAQTFNPDSIQVVNDSTLFNFGKISGKITDKETGEGIPFAKVLLFKNDIQIKGTTTDLDGNFKIETQIIDNVILDYSIEIQNIGYKSKKITNLPIVKGKNLKISSNLSAIEEDFHLVGLIIHETPLLSPFGTSGGSFSGNEIRNMGVK